MRRLFQLADIFRISGDNPELAGAQFKAFSRQLPLMYIILLVNTGFLALTHFEVAPVVLSVWVPLILFIGCCVRIALWWRSRKVSVSDIDAVRELRRTVALAPMLGIIFTAWALSLYPYGDAYRQVHIAFYMGITVVGCILCLLQLRAAAMYVIVTVLPPFVGFFALSGNPVFVAISANLLFVSGLVIFVLLEQYRSFAEMVEVQKQLLVRNAQTQRLSDANRALANIDVLTELPNRRWFFSQLDFHANTARLGGPPFALGLIDLDGFKPVNDLYGHAAGDRVLAETGRRLKEVCGHAIFVARLGGDEFALIVTEEFDEEHLRELGARICSALEAPFVANDISVQISGSVGFAVSGMDVVAKLYDKADYALYQSKQKARGTALVFNEEHEIELHDLNRVDQLLRVSNLESEMSVVFQPVVDVAQGRTKSYEALARWTSAILGPVQPELFIKAAERSGLISRLTPVLLRKTLAALTQFPGDVLVSFNLSACDLCSSETIMRIMAAITESGVDPRRLDFEITETAIMTDFDQACAALNLLRQMGSRISLDDFGSGYSSLSHIHMLPLDTIKIDRSFIADIVTNEISRNIVRSVIDLSRNLDVGCVVEGVETREQAELLSGFGITHMQGFLFGRPLGVAEMDFGNKDVIAA